MSKKSILISIIIAIGITLWYFGFFSRYNYLTAKTDIAKNNPQIVYVGESMLTPTDINNVSKNYGFEIVGFGCALSAVELKGIKIYNTQMESHLDKLNGIGWKSEYKRGIDSLIKLTNIPKTAFWIEKNRSGFWYNVDFIHSHKNNARISIFDKFGELITSSKFILVCPTDEIEFIDNLEKQIDYYDGDNIQFKSNCYLLKSK